MNWLLRQAKARPHHVALRVEGAELTWAQLAVRVQRTAAALDMVGISSGMRVAALADNGAHYVGLAWAAMWCGATLVPLNSALPDAALSWQLRHCGAELLVVDSSVANRSLTLGQVRFVQLEDLTVSRHVEPMPMSLDAAGTLIYTSGTTGEPRLVRLTWRNHQASAMASAVNLGVSVDDDWLCCLPLYHIGGLSVILRAALYGTSVTLLDGFDVDEVLRHLAGPVTLVSLVPTMLTRLARRAGGVAELAEIARRGRLRAILLGGGAADTQFVGECLEHGLPVLQTYGMTEACSQIATMPPSRALEKLGSSGFPLLGAEIEIRTPTDEDAGPGVIWVRGPMVSSGYVAPPASGTPQFVGGWFMTGDIGELDEDGFLWVQGRHDDVIITGGENVAPDVVERVIGRHPLVDDVAVYGVPDPEWGQRLLAAVVAPQATGSELDAWCKEALARHQRPKEWHFVSEIPRNSLGKITRDALTS